MFFEIIFIVLITSTNGYSFPSQYFEDLIQPRKLADVVQKVTSWLFILPGTKWCGAGDKAENYDDLGVFSIEDSCCRAHDNCRDYMLPFERKHNLKNINFIYTKLHCDCDFEFYDCLKNVNTTISDLIGDIYFNILGTNCYKYEYPIKECKKYITQPAVKCAEYLLDETKPKKYQFFDVPNYYSTRIKEMEAIESENYFTF